MSSIVPKIYVCNLCEKKYKTRSGLKYHSKNCTKIILPVTSLHPNFSGFRSDSATFEVSSEGAFCPLPENSEGDRRSPEELVVQTRPATLSPTELVVKEAGSPPCQSPLQVSLAPNSSGDLRSPSELVVRRLSAPLPELVVRRLSAPYQTPPDSVPNLSHFEGFTEGRLVVSEENLDTTDFAKRGVGSATEGRNLEPPTVVLRRSMQLVVEGRRLSDQDPSLYYCCFCNISTSLTNPILYVNKKNVKIVMCQLCYTTNRININENHWENNILYVSECKKSTEVVAKLPGELYSKTATIIFVVGYAVMLVIIFFQYIYEPSVSEN